MVVVWEKRGCLSKRKISAIVSAGCPGYMIKRLERRPGGIVRIHSDNPAYETIELQPGSTEYLDFAIFGRMVWMCREF
jgi:phage repressor protein C with HTH and peptisase S24 domain